MLVHKYGFRITYEDCILPVTALNIPGRIELSLPSPNSKPSPKAVEIVGAVLNNYVMYKNLGSYRAIQSTEQASGEVILHIIPVSHAILDARISIPEEPRNLGEMLDAITKAVSRATGASVMLGLVPIDLSPAPMFTAAIENEIAREVLLRTLERTDKKYVWLLLYDPFSQIYGLSVERFMVEVPTAPGKTQLRPVP